MPSVRTWATLALVTAALHAPSAAAQDDADAVVITATRFPERALGTAIGTRVITAADIARSAARTLPEIIGQLGGVHIRDASGSPNQQLDLRGFGITGDQNTLVLLDGVRLSPIDLSSPNLSSIPLEAIERIEILAGGGGVAYGGGTTGGTINIVTRGVQPGTQSGSVFAGGGSLATYDLRGNASASDDRLGLAMYANAYKTNNYRDNNRFDQLNVLGDLRYALDRGTLSLRFGANDQDLRLPGALTEAQIAADPRQARTPNDYSTLKGAFATASGSYRFGDVDVAADLAYRNSTAEAFFDGFFPFYLQAVTTTTQFSPRFRWELAPGGFRSQLLGGFDWFEGELDRRSAASQAGLGAPFGQSEATQRTSAGWVQVLVDLTERVRLNLGARQARAKDSLRTIEPAPVSTQNQTRSPTAYDAALRFGITESLALSGRYARSYRLPTVDENAFTFTGQLLEPQTAKQGDVGLELRVPTFMARATWYQIDLENEIYFMPLAPPFGANLNLPPTERWGWEFAVRWQPAPTLEVGAGLNLLNAEFKEGTFGGVSVAGKEVPLVPDMLANARVAWTFLPRTVLSATYNYVGKQRYDNDPANTFPQEMPAYSLVGLKVTYRDGPLTLAASVANLFDEEYYSYGIVNTFICPTFCAYPQAGRTAFASVQYQFK
ncbi:MAG: TonB-dependent receptor [Bacteroidota bacterium]|jgi:iron complex outermembrane receptor protein